MDAIWNFHFLRPTWLLALPIVVFLWWRISLSRDPLRAWRAVIAPELLDALKVSVNTNARTSQAILLAAWTIAVIALAGPTYRPEPSPFADTPVPVFVLLKASKTMDGADLLPTRMERARLKIADFARERKGQPLGLIAYAGTGHLVLPPTRDTAVVAEMAGQISPAVMPRPGDELVAALELAANTLSETSGSIVVVADTVQAGSEAKLTAFSKENNLPVHFLAIARDETPELVAIQNAAAALNGSVTKITPDTKDVQLLVKATAKRPIAVSASGNETHWEELGWYLLPLLALFSLAGFRRNESRSPSEDKS